MADKTDKTASEPLAVRWQGFRSFEDTGWLQIRPLTILLGANNSGKTALHTPLVLLKQSLGAREETQALTLWGDLVNAGTFHDIIHRHERSGLLDLSIRWHRHKPDGKPRPIGAYPPGEVRLRFAVPSPRSLNVHLQRYEVRDVLGRRFILRNRNPSGTYSLVNQARAVGDRPLRRGSSQLVSRYMKDIRKAQPHHFLFDPGDVFDVLFKDLDEPVDGSKTSRAESLKIPDPIGVYYGALSIVDSQVKRLLDGISYIGPLRERPVRLYQLSGEAPADVGIRGENAPEIMARNPTVATRASTWLRRLGLGHAVRCERVGDLAFRVVVQRTASAPEINLTDSGFGISQILPIIVEATHGRDHSLTIAEQPEIHLNPRLQTRLAELFAHIVRDGRSVIVETHSEHLVMRLRQLIARGEIPSSQVALYFVEKTLDTSTVREVPIDSLGHIQPQDWPSEFFDEALRESMNLASVQAGKRRAQ